MCSGGFRSRDAPHDGGHLEDWGSGRLDRGKDLGLSGPATQVPVAAPSCFFEGRRALPGRFRAGDLTIGDFWGVDVNRPDVLEDAEKFNQMKGVSCLLVNNNHGKEFVESSGALDLYPVQFEDIAKGNDQLRHPSVLPKDRHFYIDAFAEGGWRAVERTYKKRDRGIVFYTKTLVKRYLLKPFRKIIKTFLKGLAD